MALVATLCEPLDRDQRFVDESDVDVWIVHDSDEMPLSDRPGVTWREAPAGEEIRFPSVTCITAGSIVIATEPDLDAEIDRRRMTSDPWCDDEIWIWERPGDHN